MEPNKFQEEMQSKFSKREITPSPEAWDRLNSMLTVAEKKQKKMPWLKIAASFLIFGTIGYFIFQNQKNTHNLDPIDNNINQIVKGDDNLFDVTVSAPDTTKAAPQPESNLQSIENNKVVPNNKVYKKLSPTERAILPKEKEFENKIIQEKKRPNEIKLAENNLNETKIENKIETSIIKENISTENTSFKIKVATLDDYEGEKLNLKLDTKKEKELNPTYKKKAWEKIKTVSTAIAERNYED